MELEIKRIVPKFSLGNEKPVVAVSFPNCISTKTGEKFEWVPTYDEIKRILVEIGKLENDQWLVNPNQYPDYKFIDRSKI